MLKGQTKLINLKMVVVVLVEEEVVIVVIVLVSVVVVVVVVNGRDISIFKRDLIFLLIGRNPIFET